MGEIEQRGPAQPVEREPMGDPQPWCEFRFRWDAYRKAHVVTKRGGSGVFALSWEEVPDLDFLVVSATGRGSRAVAVEMVRMLNAGRPAELVPPAEVAK